MRALFVLRHGPPRWPAGLRAAIGMGGPVLVGWLAGDLAAGLTASLGGFTVLYGAGRPYWNRAWMLAVIAVSISVAVAVGTWAASIALIGVLAVALIAAVATLFCNALAVGPPGAYFFALVCAIGTGLHAYSPAHAAALALAGGALAWLLHMSGALVRPRGPEVAAVRAAGRAVAGYSEAVGGEREEVTRHAAAEALQQAWATLIDRQPRERQPAAALRRLRGASRELQLLFAAAMAAARDHRPSPPDLAAKARALARDPLEQAGLAVVSSHDELPLEPPGAWEVLRHDMRLHSRSLLVVARVGIAALIAGSLGSLFGLQHAYWAMTAAVLMLDQGLDRRRTTQRGLERLAGTLLGLGLAAAIIAAEPDTLWFVVAIVALNFLIELTVTKSYALAVVFITAIALLIATGGQQPSDLGSLLLERGLDTVLGCAVAMAVFLATVPARIATWLPDSIAETLDAAAAAIACMSPARVAGAAARAARRELQQRALDLAQAFDIAINGSTAQRQDAERRWAAVAATQSLAYRALAAGWQPQRRRGHQQRGGTLPEQAADLQEELRDLRDALAREAI